MNPDEQPSNLEEALEIIQRLRAERDGLRGGTIVSSAPVENGRPGLQPGSVPRQKSDNLDAGEVRAHSDPVAKIALFQSLFRGREDIYALRWERDGRSGYAPALRPGVPRGRQYQHEAHDYLPLTADVVRGHLMGTHTLGVYPLLRDDTCWFLAFDFDKDGWRQDVLAVLAACDGLGIPAALERSRSGQGAHLWVFFAQPIAASVARNLGSAALTRALDRRYQIGLDSYDRLFPSQDTLPAGGFGNLIAVPLQGVSRRNANSVFLDRSLEPYPDQWQFLSSIRKVEAEEAERIVEQVTRTDTILPGGPVWIDDDGEPAPWKVPPSRRRADVEIPGPLPQTITMVRANRLFIEKRALSPVLINRLRRLATFQNPEFYRAQQLRLSTFGKPRLIDCSEDLPSHLAVPRGCLDEVITLAETNGIAVSVTDERHGGTAIQAPFRGELRPKQLEAAEVLAAADTGVLCAPTAFGKTVIGAWLIARRQVNTLVVVHRQHLADQWRERLAAFLDVPPGAIGLFGGGKRRPTGVIDIALLQSLTRNGEVKDLVAEYGQVIVDECHHVPAFSFERSLSEVRARFIVGLTATPVRKDGHHPIIAMQCGPLRFTVDAKEETAARPFDHEVLLKLTGFKLRHDEHAPGIQEIYTQLVANEPRTTLIVADVVNAIRAGRSPLVLTERTDHLERMAKLLEGHGYHVLVLRGGMSIRARRDLAMAMKSIADDEPRVLLATGRYIGEGFDDARLDTLFLALPVSWRGTVQQYVGRLHRLHASKRVVQVVDYVDANVPMLKRMSDKRLKGYKEIGYSVVGEARTPRRTSRTRKAAPPSTTTATATLL
ncbi:MAG: DEAD/DEAH box helicase [Chloroflexi bacterium]|nr:DEAD/DEAH box helicase [Chloroflexota bacterium]